jgi:hypothetical protein
VRPLNTLIQRTAADNPSRQADAGIAILGLLLMCSVAAAFALYLKFSHNIYPLTFFDSDDSAALLFANEVIQQRSFFPDWSTSTGLWLPFLWPLHTILPILLTFSSDWMAAYRSAVTVDQIIFSLLIWFVLGRVGASRAMRALLLTFLFASPSIDYARQTVLNGGKSWIYAQLLTLAFLCYRCLPLSGTDNLDPRQQTRRLAPVAVLASLLFIDRSYIGQLVPPLFAALCALCLLETNLSTRRQIRQALLLFGVLLAAIGVGQIVFYVVVLHTSAYHPIAPRFVDLNTAGNNIQLLVRGLIEWFGAAPAPGQAVYSAAALICFIKLALLITIFLLPLFVLSRWQHLGDNFLRLLAVLFAVDLAMRSFVFIFTDVSQNSTETIRYFIPVSLLGLTVSLRYVELHWDLLLARGTSLLIAFCFLLSSPFMMARPPGPPWQQTLARTAEETDLRRGYATWEYAGQLTAISDNRIQVRPIFFMNGGFVPLHWLSSNRWFVGDAHVRESFLLLSNEQRDTGLQAYERLLGSPTRTLSIGTFRMLVYPFDIAWHLGWRHTLNQPLTAPDMRAALETTEPPVQTAVGTQLVDVRVTNLGNIPFGTTGSLPVQLGAHLLNPDGTVQDRDLPRTCLPMIEPGQSAQIVVALPSSRVSGNIVELDVVQDGVGWFGDVGSKTLRIAMPKIEYASAPSVVH